MVLVVGDTHICECERDYGIVDERRFQKFTVSELEIFLGRPDFKSIETKYFGSTPSKRSEEQEEGSYSK